MPSRRILILGATSAIAAEVARIYAKQGDALYLVGRDAEKLARLVSELGSAVRGSVAGDLDELDENGPRVQRAIEALGGLDVALVAHGLLGDQIRSETDLDHAREILQTNLLSAVSLLIPIANHLERQRSGSVGAITSAAGERGRPRNYTYGTAKGGLTRYLQGIRSRLYSSGVRVVNLKLGPVDTPMTRDHAKHFLFGEKVAVARGIVRALDGRRHVVYLPPVWGPIMAIVRLCPELVIQSFGFLGGR